MGFEKTDWKIDQVYMFDQLCNYSRSKMLDDRLGFRKKIGRLTDSMGLINYALTHNKIFSMTNWDLKRLTRRSINFTSLTNFALIDDQRRLMTN